MTSSVQVGPVPASTRRLIEPFGPMAWAYLDLSGEGVDARATQVRGVLDQLAAAGAPQAAVAAIGERFRDTAVAPLCLAVFADASGAVLHERHVHDPHVGDRAGWSVPPDVLAVLADDQRRAPYVFVALDRAGADLVFSTGGTAPDAYAVVGGTDDEIRHSAPGGWASLQQSRFQRRAEDSWKHNAYQVADEVAARAEDVGAQAILVAGEPHVVHHLRERLPEALAGLVRPVAGSRASFRSARARRDVVQAELEQFEREQTGQLLDQLAANDDGDLAVRGRSATVAALATGRVGVLLVDPAAAVAPVLFGDEPQMIFTNRRRATAAGCPLAEAPLGLAATRSALLSGAQVRVLPAGAGGLRDGLGALCRFRLGHGSP